MKQIQMGGRVLKIIIKWVVIGTFITFLWFAGVFHLLFAIFLLFIDQVNLFLEWLSTGTQLEAKQYWALYGRYWLIGYVVLSVILAIIYFIPYRKARPVLKVGNRKEGYVIWMKGIRRGFTYEVWDTYNFLFKKNPIGWPNPLTIPRGPDMKSGVCIVFRPPWSLKPKYLYMPDSVRVESKPLSVHIPDGYFVNVPNRERLDITDLMFVERSTIGYREFDVQTPIELHKKHLARSRKMVQSSVASNPEINQMDFTTGSFAVLGADNE